MAIAPVSTAAMEFIKWGYNIIPFPEGATLVAPVIQGFTHFLDEPMRYRKRWTFNLDSKFDKHGRSDPDDGYLRRDGGGHDKKHIFQYRPRLIPALEKAKVNLRDHASWISATGELYDACDRVVRDFNRQVGEYISRCSLAERMKDPIGRDQTVLRLLFYDRSGVDPLKPEMIAQPHTDKDLDSLHVDESHPGLQYGEEHISWEARPGEALVFPGQKFEALMDDFYPEEHFTALEHQVITHNHNENRWSVVFFFHIDYRRSSRS